MEGTDGETVGVTSQGPEHPVTSSGSVGLSIIAWPGGGREGRGGEVGVRPLGGSFGGILYPSGCGALDTRNLREKLKRAFCRNCH